MTTTIPTDMTTTPTESSAEALAFYAGALSALQEADVEFLVGGAYAFERYTGIARHTKDLDVFVRPADRDAGARGPARRPASRTELTFPHWLGKAFCGDDVRRRHLQLRQRRGRVDDAWFEHAVAARGPRACRCGWSRPRR